ncbi:TPA: carbohydrate-binding protein [Candidatus Sumerlaeota bacterium]|jgi:arabinoxylan arabinofuranohydrolase|nr:carbohydrate-binding protein [Candidatus Sumerlaeota bacterium]
MKNSAIQQYLASIVLALIACWGTICFADNPIVQTMYTADPAPFVHNGVLYAYLDHDEDGTYGWFKMKDWRCFSTTDMVNWTDLGVVASLKTFSWAKIDAWAGQVVYRNSKFYYYVPMRLSGDMFGIGVGVSDKPEGPFTDAIGKPLISGNGYIDPTVFVDDDGRAYLFCGNPKLFTVKLNSDMITTASLVTQVPTTGTTFKNQYLEGPWFYKRGGLYYMLFSSQNNGTPGKEDIRYSTSPSPDGPWTFGGCIQPVQAGGKSWTNHCGVVDYKGNSYFFYHTGDLPKGSGFTRSTCVELFKYNADGTIPEIPMTKTGAAQIGTLNPYARVEAETICFSFGVKTEVCSAGGVNVCKIKNNSYIKVKGVDFTKDAKSFTASVASDTKGGKIEIYLDNLTTGTVVGTLVGTLDVPSTGGAQEWKEKSCKIKNAKGVHDLYFKFVGEDGVLFNFDWWKFE